MLLRVPGVGVKSAQKIVAARRTGRLDFDALKKIGVVLKRAQYFLLCSGRRREGLRFTPSGALRAMMSERCLDMLPGEKNDQLSLFEDSNIAEIQAMRKERTSCLARI